MYYEFESLKLKKSDSKTKGDLWSVVLQAALPAALCWDKVGSTTHRPLPPPSSTPRATAACHAAVSTSTSSHTWRSPVC